MLAAGVIKARNKGLRDASFGGDGCHLNAIKLCSTLGRQYSGSSFDVVGKMYSQQRRHESSEVEIVGCSPWRKDIYLDAIKW